MEELFTGTIARGVTIESPPGPTLAQFEGYDAGLLQPVRFSSSTVRFSLDFYYGRIVDIGCAESNFGNTRHEADVRDPVDSVIDRWRTKVALSSYVSCNRINVTSAGNFTFDTCRSQFPVALGLYPGSDGCTGEGLIAYDTVNSTLSPNPMYPLWDPHYAETDPAPETRIPWHHGCKLSPSALRTVYLEPGQYILAVRGHMWNDDPGGDYALSMACHGAAAATSKEHNDPGGFSVEPQTGVVTGTPQRTGAYRAINLVASYSSGHGIRVAQFTFNVTDQPPASEPLGDAVFVAIEVGSVLLVLAGAVFVVVSRRGRKGHAPFDFRDVLESLDRELVFSPAAEKIYPTEIRRSHLTMLGDIAHGAFGTVHKAVYSPSRRRRESVPVAVKMLRRSTLNVERNGEFLREAAISTQFVHENCMEVVGVVTRGTPHLLITRFYARGSLLEVLQTELVAQQGCLGYCRGVATGMQYLHSLQFVHRDLAARNVLVDLMDVPKIADFGLSRNLDAALYYQPAGCWAMLATRWCSPEVLSVQRFSEASDVWSFGVLCWEVYSRGQLPYKGWSNAAVEENIRLGCILKRPAACGQEIYDAIVWPCFHRTPANRPSFATLRDAAAATASARLAPVPHAPITMISTSRSSDLPAPTNAPFDLSAPYAVTSAIAITPPAETFPGASGDRSTAVHVYEDKPSTALVSPAPLTLDENSNPVRVLVGAEQAVPQRPSALQPGGPYQVSVLSSEQRHWALVDQAAAVGPARANGRSTHYLRVGGSSEGSHRIGSASAEMPHVYAAVGIGPYRVVSASIQNNIEVYSDDDVSAVGAANLSREDGAL